MDISHRSNAPHVASSFALESGLHRIREINRRDVMIFRLSCLSEADVINGPVQENLKTEFTISRITD